MTFQSVILTDGLKSYVTNLYQDAGFSWRPVFDVPRDIQYYPAMSGYIIQGKKPVVWQHNVSGIWKEEISHELTVYRMDEVRFSTVSFNFCFLNFVKTAFL